MTAVRTTLSDIAQAYYSTGKTTIEPEDYLRPVFEKARNLPYFERAENTKTAQGDTLSRDYIFVSDKPHETQLWSFMLVVTYLAKAEGLEVQTDMNHPNILTVKAEPGTDSGQFKSFTKGLGILLRAATQDLLVYNEELQTYQVKKREGYNSHLSEALDNLFS